MNIIKRIHNSETIKCIFCFYIYINNFFFYQSSLIFSTLKNSTNKFWGQLIYGYALTLRAKNLYLLFLIILFYNKIMSSNNILK